MSLPVDHHSRSLALSPDQSFIVQAPAGSGKTELLIQRILRLLSTVDEPESVLAITFTRKAASEIRARVMAALSLARHGQKPQREPDATTFDLAIRVLERSAKRQWDIEQNPNRLQLVTIDSLCSSIAKNAPVTNSFGSIPQITEDAEHLYRKAVKNTLFSLEDESDPLSHHLATLFCYLDNHALLVEELLISMLFKRQQWLQAVIPMGAADAREYLESVLKEQAEQMTATSLSCFTDHDRQELVGLFDDIELNLRNYGQDSVYQSGDGDDVFLSNATTFLMTSSFGYRKSLTKGQGLLAPSAAKSKDDKELLKSLKARALDCLQGCRDRFGDELPVMLKQYAMIPPTSYTDQQWDIMMSLIEVLKACVGNLKLVFAEQSQADFSEISQSALMALGMHENPSDLALSLDYRIQHILVDEFQDTSLIQYELLRLLTSGWEVDDGRTLFLVGDPMQAIYRFRDAEVANFILARQNGISQVDLKPLYLEQNFRSDQHLVTSFNTIFNQVFAQEESLAKGEVSFVEARAFQSDRDYTQLTVEAFGDSQGRALESERVADLVKASLQLNESASIAILARSRSHLADISKTLKDNAIAFNSVEMDSVTTRPAVIDVLSLARAIYRHGDVTAWAAVMRQPFLAMTLRDIEAVLRYTKDNNITVYQALGDDGLTGGFDRDVCERIGSFLERLSPIIAMRHQVTLYRTIKRAAAALGFESMELRTTQLTDLEFTYRYLSDSGDANDLPHVEQLERGLKAKFATELATSSSNVHLMTIHKSKGLQFDTVILPGLDRSSGQPQQKLLNWHTAYSDEGQQDLIMAPLKPASEAFDPTYKYIEMLSSNLEREEMKRLLYVAMTRAKHRLHLVSVLPSLSDGGYRPPSKNTLLGVAWGGLQPFLTYQEGEAVDTHSMAHQPSSIAVKRPVFSLEDINTLSNKSAQTQADINSGERESLDNMCARTVGDLLHLELEVISLKGLQTIEEGDLEKRKDYYRAYLIESGHFSHGLALHQAVSSVVSRLKTALSNSQLRAYLDDPIGSCQSEYELQQSTFDTVRTYRIDRLYEDNNTIVILDYKSDQKAGGETDDAFVERMRATYAHKMAQYRALFQCAVKKVSAQLYLFETNQFVEV